MRIHVSTKVFVNIAESSELELYLQNASEVEVRKTTRLVSVKAVDRLQWLLKNATRSTHLCTSK